MEIMIPRVHRYKISPGIESYSVHFDYKLAC